MDLEASTDCDGSCSGLDLVGQRLVSHEECNNLCDEAIDRLKPNFIEKLQDKYPRFYGFLRKIGIY